MMRRAYAQALIALIIVSTLIAPAYQPVLASAGGMMSENSAALAQTGPYAVASGAVNIRSGPGTGFWTKGTLYLGEVIPILGISPDGAWWYVNTRLGEGWVAQISVTAVNALDVPMVDPGPVGTVAAGVLHVRYGAGENAASVGQISKGQQVFVLARNADGSWLQIRWAYGTGWVAARFLNVNGTPGAIVDDGIGGMESEIPLTADMPYALVMATYLNIRTGPGINYAVLGRAYAGDMLAIVGRSADNAWYQVNSVAGTGWVSAAFVVTRNEYGASPVTTGTAAGAEITGPIGIINTGALNLRSGPGIQYTDIGTLAGGTQTRIIGRSNDWTWWLLETPAGNGWANAIYVIVRGDISGVPYVAPGATNGTEGAVAPAAAAAGPVAFVIGGALNIRSGPNSVFPALGSVPGGTRMPIIGQSPDRGWWYVESPFGNGYVSKLYVIAEGNTNGVPIIQ